MTLLPRLFCFAVWLSLTTVTCLSNNDNNINDDDTIGANVAPHTNDPNDEDYEGMIYMGRLYENGTRVGFDHGNAITYVFGSSLHDNRRISEEELFHPHDVPERKTREQVLQERRHAKVHQEGPKPFGHVDIHELDGGVVPTKVVSVEPYFMDATLVTNKQFGKFVKSTYYETEAEQFGWSFVLESFVSSTGTTGATHDKDPDAEHWVAVDGAYWRRPEGPTSSYKFREHHPVVHVSHRDAAEYCAWVGKRLPGEREYEAAARSGYWGPSNRTKYWWGSDDNDDNDDEVVVAKKYANLWQGKFPFENLAIDEWRGTSPVTHYQPNSFGFYDLIGNVWEWQRGGKHQARIVRGASYVDTLDGEFNHAATSGARATLHGTTTAGNIGFRCAKAVTRPVEHHYVNHDDEEATQGQLAMEDQFGKQDMIPQPGWKDRFQVDGDDDDEFSSTPKKKKVVKPRTTISKEL